jgi:glycosyltransferase involved in cell wall biosynthesis
MNDASTLLTIVVPTKNRPLTASALIQSLLAQPARDFEIVVQDCSEDDRLARALERFTGDERLGYQHSGRPVSMTENWNLAMARVRGEYTIFIGDDDGCSERIISAARWALAHDLDGVSWTLRSRYFWPDYPEASVAGFLLLSPCTATHDEIDPLAELAASSHGHGDRIGRLPRAYHGIIRTRCLHDLRKRSGEWFKGRTPDYYSAYALSGYARHSAHFDFPFSIIGSCGTSNTARAARLNFRRQPGEHHGEYASVEWPDILPDMRLMTSVLAESMISGLQSAGQSQLTANIDLAAIYADYFYAHPLQATRALPRFVRASQQLGRSTFSDLLKLGKRVPAVMRAVTQETLERRVRALLGWATLEPQVGAERRAAPTICEATRLHDSFYRSIADQRLPS